MNRNQNPMENVMQEQALDIAEEAGFQAWLEAQEIRPTSFIGRSDEDAYAEITQLCLAWIAAGGRAAAAEMRQPPAAPKRLSFYERDARAKNLRTLRQLEAVRAELGHGGLMSPADLDDVAQPSWLETAHGYFALLDTRSQADDFGFAVSQPVRVGELEMITSPWDQGQRGEYGLFLVHRTCTGNTVVAAGVDGVFIWARRRESIAGIRSLGWEAPAELLGEPTRVDLVWHDFRV